jgi:hypothetical protein
MVIRLGAIILAAALVCGSAQAQSLLLNKGERGEFCQLGYLWPQGGGVNAFEGDFGYAFSDRLDIGGGIMHSSIETGDIWSSDRRSSTTSVAQFADLFPVRLGNDGVALVPGLHQTYSRTFAQQQGAWFGIGASLSLKMCGKGGSGLILTGGFNHASSGGGTRDNAILGATLTVRLHSNNKINLLAESAPGNGPDTYGVGLGFAWVVGK